MRQHPQPLDLCIKAIADAFRNGRLGVMDYYNMRNVIADTDMRSAIGSGGSSDGSRTTPQSGSQG